MRRTLLTLLGVGVGSVYALLLHTFVYAHVTAAIMLVFVGGLVGWIASHPRLNRPSGTISVPVFVVAVFPFYVVVFVVGFASVSLAMAALIIYAVPAGMIAESRFRRRLKDQGRFLAMRDLRPMLEAGKGTLIEEIDLDGSRRICWTADNLLLSGEPVKDEDEYLAVLTGEKDHTFNAYCLREYLDLETGKAVLTPLPPRHVRSGKLAREFPRTTVAMIVNPHP